MRDMREHWREDERWGRVLIWLCVANVISVLVFAGLPPVLYALDVLPLVICGVLAVQGIAQIGLLIWMIVAFLRATEIH